MRETPRPNLGSLPLSIPFPKCGRVLAWDVVSAANRIGRVLAFHKSGNRTEPRSVRFPRQGRAHRRPTSATYGDMVYGLSSGNAPALIAHQKK